MAARKRKQDVEIGQGNWNNLNSYYGDNLYSTDYKGTSAVSEDKSIGHRSMCQSKSSQSLCTGLQSGDRSRSVSRNYMSDDELECVGHKLDNYLDEEQSSGRFLSRTSRKGSGRNQFLYPRDSKNYLTKYEELDKNILGSYSNESERSSCLYSNRPVERSAVEDITLVQYPARVSNINMKYEMMGDNSKSSGSRPGERYSPSHVPHKPPLPGSTATSTPGYSNMYTASPAGRDKYSFNIQQTTPLNRNNNTCVSTTTASKTKSEKITVKNGSNDEKKRQGNRSPYEGYKGVVRELQEQISYCGDSKSQQQQQQQSDNVNSSCSSNNNNGFWMKNQGNPIDCDIELETSPCINTCSYSNNNTGGEGVNNQSRLHCSASSPHSKDAAPEEEVDDESCGKFSPTSEFQEGLKSILYWHLIGSYQNLHKLSDEDCGDFLIGLRDQASLDYLDPKDGSIKLEKSPVTSPTERISKRPKSLASNTKIQPQLGLVTFCTCGLIGGGQNDSPVYELKNQIVANEDIKSPHLCEAKSPNDYSDGKVCYKCGKYLQNRYLTPTSPPTTTNNTVQADSSNKTPSESDDDQECKITGSNVIDNHVIASTILSAKPDILANPQFKKLDTALDCLRRDSLDGESKLKKLLELDSALDYLVDMVTEKVNTPVEMTEDTKAKMFQGDVMVTDGSCHDNDNCQYTCHHPCRKMVTLDCAQNEDKMGVKPGEKAVLRGHMNEPCLAKDKPQVDDTDSGYHTGDNTLAEQARRAAGLIPKPPGEFTLTREELRKSIEAFNFNNYGLIMSLQQDSITFQGFIRVHMNLIRPINMSLSVRPPSIYEVLSHEEEGEEHNDNTQIASFYLPKDTTKVIHISSDTTTQEVIRTLLGKFRITDNPRKFALYERVEEEGCQAVMRRLVEDEQPLPLCLSWGLKGLKTHKFVLQENDTGEIIWDAFSIPELDNFLKILNREEAEYVEQIKAKYNLMHVHIIKKLEEMDTIRKKQREKDREKQANISSALQYGMNRNGQQNINHQLGASGDNTDSRNLQLNTNGEKSRNGKEKSPPADKFGEDEREPIFV